MMMMMVAAEAEMSPKMSCGLLSMAVPPVRMYNQSQHSQSFRQTEAQTGMNDLQIECHPHSMKKIITIMMMMMRLRSLNAVVFSSLLHDSCNRSPQHDYH